MATSAHRADFRDIKHKVVDAMMARVQGYIEEEGKFQENAALALLRRKPEGLHEKSHQKKAFVCESRCRAVPHVG